MKTCGYKNKVSKSDCFRVLKSQKQNPKSVFKTKTVLYGWTALTGIALPSAL